MKIPLLNYYKIEDLQTKTGAFKCQLDIYSNNLRYVVDSIQYTGEIYKTVHCTTMQATELKELIRITAEHMDTTPEMRKKHIRRLQKIQHRRLKILQKIQTSAINAPFSTLYKKFIVVFYHINYLDWEKIYFSKHLAALIQQQLSVFIEISHMVLDELKKIKSLHIQGAFYDIDKPPLTKTEELAFCPYRHPDSKLAFKYIHSPIRGPKTEKNAFAERDREAEIYEK